MIHGMFNGSIPKAETLTTISRAENININWLLTGLGSPYQVMGCWTDGESAHHIGMLMGDEPGAWSAYWITDGIDAVVVLTMPVVWGDGDDAISIIEVEILPVAGPMSMAQLKKQPPCRQIEADSDTIQQLRSGNIGTWQLTRPDGLLSQAKQVQSYAQVSEQHSSYNALTPQQQHLNDLFCQLNDDQQQALVSMAESIIPKTHA